MAIVSLKISICLLVMLQISYSYAKVDPNDYFQDRRTGLRRLNFNTRKLSESELEEVRDIITYNEGHEKYCKLRAVRPKVPFLFHTNGVKNWCYKEGPNGEEHYGSNCCEGEGYCSCPFKGRYDCECK